MNKNIVVSFIVILIVAIAGFFFYKNKQAPVSNTSATTKAIETGTKAQSSVSSGVEKTNPFNVNVNPYQGYKNPFQ